MIVSLVGRMAICQKPAIDSTCKAVVRLCFTIAATVAKRISSSMAVAPALSDPKSLIS